MSTASSTTGKSVDLAPMDRPNSFGAAFDADGTLYITTNEDTFSRLSRINPVTGETIQIGGLVTNDESHVQAIDFDRNGDLYALSANGALYRITRSAGQGFQKANNRDDLVWTLVGDTGVKDVTDIAINSLGELVGVAGGRLFTFDTSTGAASSPLEITIEQNELLPVEPIISASDIMGVMFDENDQLLATACVCPSPIFALSMSTGVASFLANSQLCFPVGGDCAPTVDAGFGPLSLVARGAPNRSGSRFSSATGGSPFLPIGGAGGAGIGGGGSGSGGGIGNPSSPTDDPTTPPTPDPPPIAELPEPSLLIVFVVGLIMVIARSSWRRHCL